MSLSARNRVKKITPNSAYLDNFLDSGLNPDDQRKYVMFYGTDKAAAEMIKKDGFTPSREDRMLGAGVYVSRDINKASKYPLGVPKSQRRVLKVLVDVGKVKIIDRKGHPMQKTWHQHGFDTAWVPPGVGMVESGQEEDCVYDPSRIKVIEVIKVKKRNMSKYNFLKSGVTPEDKHLYVMYHGTTTEAAVQIQRSGFLASADGMLGKGVYVTRDIRKAIKYPIGVPDSDKMILKLKVDVGKVKRIDRQGHPMQKTWHQHGFDTAWLPSNVGMVPSGQEEDCVYDPSRIKVLTMLKVEVLKLVNPSLND